MRLFLPNRPYNGTNHVATFVYDPVLEGTFAADNAWHVGNMMAGLQMQNRNGSDGVSPCGAHLSQASFASYAANPMCNDLYVFAVEVGFGSTASTTFRVFVFLFDL